MPCLILIILAIFSTEINQSRSEDLEGEGRIYSGAPIGTKVTLHPNLEKLFAKFSGCFMQPDMGSDNPEFEWDVKSRTLRMLVEAQRTYGEAYSCKVTTLCSDKPPNVISVIVRVSAKNRCTPQFKKQHYTFYLPWNTHIDNEIVRAEVTDCDKVIYNSDINIDLLQNDDQVFSYEETTSSIKLIKRLTSMPEKTLHTINIRACDYGSPQLCGLQQMKVYPVNLTAPRYVSMNHIDPNYLIVKWQQQNYGSANFYNVYVHEYENVNISSLTSVKTVTKYNSSDGYNFITMVKLNNTAQSSAFVTVTAVNPQHETPAPPLHFNISQGFSSQCHYSCGKGGYAVCKRNAHGSLVEFLEKDTPACLCYEGWHGPHCDQKAQCPKSVTELSSGTWLWSATSVNNSAFSYCPYGPQDAYSTRQCHWKTGHPQWNEPDFTYEDKCFTRAELLSRLAYISVVVMDQPSLSEPRRKQLIQNIDSVMYTTYTDKKVANIVLSLMSLALTKPWLVGNSQSAIESGEKLIDLLKDYSYNVVINDEEIEERLETRDIKIAVIKPPQNRNKQSMQRIDFSNDRVSSINIPGDIWDGIQSEDARISAIYMEKSTFYTYDDPNYVVLELSATDDVPVTQMKSPVLIDFVVPETKKTNYTCVYWNKAESSWSKDGVQTFAMTDSNTVRCSTTHFTGFAVLLDFNIDRRPIDSGTRDTLNLLSWLGCSLSMIGLLLTFITYLVFRFLCREASGKILVNLCLAMFLMNFSFIFSSLRAYTNYSKESCVTIGAMVHLWTICSLTWMGIEALNMYQVLVKVFSQIESFFLTKRLIIGYGTALFLVAIALLFDSDCYAMENEAYCQLSTRCTVLHTVTYLLPACLILAINLVVFLILLRVLIQSGDAPRRAGEKTNTLSVQIRGAMTVMVLLGVTWIFGAFAIGPMRLPFMYIFCILNSAQGFIIFLVRCLLYDEARDSWRQLFATGKVKKTRGKIVAGGGMSTHSTSGSNVTHRSGITNSDTRRPLLSPDSTMTNLTLPEPVQVDTKRLSVRNSWKFVDDPPSPNTLIEQQHRFSRALSASTPSCL